MANKPDDEVGFFGNEAVGSINTEHMLVSNTLHDKGKVGSGKCLLCKMRGVRSDASYGCTGCTDYFHVDCYSILNFFGALKRMNDVLDKFIGSNKKNT